MEMVPIWRRSHGVRTLDFTDTQWLSLTRLRGHYAGVGMRLGVGGGGDAAGQLGSDGAPEGEKGQTLHFKRTLTSYPL